MKTNEAETNKEQPLPKREEVNPTVMGCQRSNLIIDSDRLNETDDYILSEVDYHTNRVVELDADGNKGPCYRVTPLTAKLQIRTKKRTPRLGVMLVGAGGNNASTLIGMTMANRKNLTWNTKKGQMSSNYYGSVLKSGTISLGTLSEPDENGMYREISIPLCEMLPIVNPNDIVFEGWDINSKGMREAMNRAEVFEPELQNKLSGLFTDFRPKPSIFNEKFVASNQSERADNVLTGTWKEQIEIVRNDIREFKHKNNLDQVIVMWTASTERMTPILAGVNDTAENLMKAVERNNPDEVAPSTLFGIASAYERCPFINGSPQNTLVPGLVELARQNNSYVAGDDFKTGQTKVKSCLVEFLVNSAIKPRSIVSYNHLGNNDGHNLSAAQQFRSKEVTKRGVIDDIVASNHVLYKENEQPDHCIVIKYVPFVGDSKRAMDEYTSEICMGGLNTLAIYNTCEDSLLAATVMLDLILLCELLQRIEVRVVDVMEEGAVSRSDKPSESEFDQLDTVMSILGLFLKSPQATKGEPIVNAFSRQLCAIKNLFLACVGLQPDNHMKLEFKIPSLRKCLSI